jgi:4-carboxymuconolactone decarboxylase
VSRLGTLRPEDLTPEQWKLREAMTQGPRGASAASGGPFEVWLHSPQFGDRVQRFGAFVRYQTSLCPRLSELAILACARHWRSDYEWYAHSAIAARAGLSTEAIEAIRCGTTVTFEGEPDLSVYRFCQELLATHRICAATYDSAERALGKVALVELVGLLGYYSLVALTLNAFEVPTPDHSRPLSDSAHPCTST